MAFYAVLLAAAVFILALLAYPHWRAYRQAQYMAQPFPEAWRRILQHRVPLFRRLPADLQLQLKKRIQVFIAEKQFIGCAGLQVTDEMRVVIAAQACMLVLNRSLAPYAHLRQILVYPGAFVTRRTVTDSAGIQQDQRQVLSGESWVEGQVILSWQDSLEGAAVPDDGRNVVLHEFAHQLDQESGDANGAPPRAPGDTPYRGERWQQVFSQAYEDLQDQVERGEQGLLNHYGAQSPAEFFAVVTETFFEQAASLALEYPELFQELTHYYQVDPSHWH